LIGFLLGCCGVLWSQKSNTGLGMMAPLVVLSLPLADTGLAIVRRLLRGRPIFQGDRGHIHHRLLNRGLSPREVAFLLYGVCTVSAIVSLCLEKKYFAVPMISLFGVLAWLGIQHLGYVEINLLARLVFQGSFQGLVRSHITFHDFEVRACAANTPGEFWEALRSYCAELGLSQIQMRLLGQMYSDGIEVRSISGTLYSVVKLADGDFVELSRQISNSRDDSITAFADKIHRILAAKRTVFLGQTEPAESEPHYVLAGAAAAGN
jgi:UDP-GlcNAc:undecaprenyl-phosphate GlcNAc-1-phosphate transferase